MNSGESQSGCSSSGCGCGSSRREVLQLAAASATVALLGQGAVAGPFEGKDFEQLIPADKKLKPEWIQSLRQRGQPTAFRGAELQTIGMPVGGICAGQVYLGGDGRLWHWDIFNLPQQQNFVSTAGPNYAKPPKPESPIEQGFAIKVGSVVKRLDARGIDADAITFRGQYPIGVVEYRDKSLPVEVTLEAFSPFIPLNFADSSLPATLMRYTVRNTSNAEVEVELAGWVENGVCLASGRAGLGRRLNRLSRQDGCTVLHCTAEPVKAPAAPKRPDIVFEDFEKGYDKWKSEGKAFGDQPATGTLPNQQQVAGFQGKRLVNTFLEGDSTTGRLLSQPFKIERNFIAFLIGGGDHADRTCMNLLIDGKRVRTAAGKASERLQWADWDVREHAGKEAQLEIVDKENGPWGHINVDQILFTDSPPLMRPIEQCEDFGSMALAVVGDGSFAATRMGADPATAFVKAEEQGETAGEAAEPFGQKLVGAVGRRVRIAAGASSDVVFIATWYFPQPAPSRFGGLADGSKLRHSYSTRFKSAAEVSGYVAQNLDRLVSQTRLWHRTWYGSTLPHWFLERTFIPICTLATSTCFRFDNGRFYAYEGVLCCQGTCQHVWNYAQSVARIFPELEQDLRRRTDFGTSWHENGATDYRGEYARHVAHDGQCGVILRTWREHLMAPDDSYLKPFWPRVKKSIEYLIGCDKDENGLIEGEQYNTLDDSWWGPMAWISSFYIAALRAGEAMARDMGDEAFAQRCAKIAAAGSDNLVKQLYNGEYFIHKTDPARPDTTNTNNGCHIDQLMGQAWAMQVSLPRIAAHAETLSALRAIWKYNFTPDVGPFRTKSLIRGGRWYAMAGEGGVIMTTFPRGGAETASGKGRFAYYFNEVWTGQEHQLAAHMLNEGLIDEALVITRVIHDRHHAARHNPFNEVECSDHYSRAMSSHGTYLAACGFEYHGPRGELTFTPRIGAEDFSAAFVAAEGWGTFAQKLAAGDTQATVQVAWGKLRLKQLTLAAPGKATCTLGDQPVASQSKTVDGKTVIVFAQDVTLTPEKPLRMRFA